MARAPSRNSGDCASPPASEAPRVKREAGHEDPSPTEQIGGATAEQQEAGRRHRVSADHPLQRLCGEAELAPDRGQCHQHDVLIERGGQHREGQQSQHRRMAVPGALVVRDRLGEKRGRSGHTYSFRYGT
jgi:hypothetical protein